LAGPRADVVVLGAGLAGMTAAYHLRDLDVLVLERRDRVGGRTLSGERDGYWYNSGAQFVWDPRTLALCHELGLEVVPGTGAAAAVYLRGRLAAARTPYGLLGRMPLSLREKADFAWTITRLRRRAARMQGLDAELDSVSLADLIGRTTPVTREILEMATQSGTGLGTADVSGAIGLGYAIHLFGGDVNETLKGVRGGTQRITQAEAAALDPERVQLKTTVEAVEAGERSVMVSYRGPGGGREEIEASACVVAVTADAVLEAVPGLPDAKREALQAMLPYAPIVSAAWLTDEGGPMPWDGLLAVPALGASFELFSNSAFFARRGDPVRRPGGAFVTLSTGPRAVPLWDLADGEVAARLRTDLQALYPEGSDVLARAEVRIERWRGLPAFRRGWLARQRVLREPLGRIHFCGDYTAQPGTPGAVGSGFHAARTVRAALG
jgi:oxygen-dependent protoporphyrinogen oxidase